MIILKYEKVKFGPYPTSIPEPFMVYSSSFGILVNRASPLPENAYG